MSREDLDRKTAVSGVITIRERNKYRKACKRCGIMSTELIAACVRRFIKDPEVFLEMLGFEHEQIKVWRSKK